MATCHVNLTDVATILAFIEKATKFAQFSPKLAEMILSPWILDFQNCLFISSNLNDYILFYYISSTHFLHEWLLK